MIRIHSPLEQYDKAGFQLAENPNGTLGITAISKPTSLRDHFPSSSQEFDVSDELFFQCALNLSIFGPGGSMIIDPAEEGLLVHAPNFAKAHSMRLNPRGRTLFRHGFWLVDVVHGLDKSTTAINEKKLEDTFNVSRQEDGFVVERKLVHQMPAYRSKYVVKFRPDGSAVIGLKGRRFWSPISRRKQDWQLEEVLVRAGVPGFFGIDLKFKKRN